MKSKRWLGLSLVLGCAVLGALSAHAQPMGGHRDLAVTNTKFKAFQPTFGFEAHQAQHPAVITEREARDYCAWAGKRLGHDLAWRRIPKSDKGILMVEIDMDVTEEVTEATADGVTAPPGMVYVPEGPFIMGSETGDPDESPQHTANTGPFFIDVYEVGNADFKLVFPDFEFPAGREDHAAVVTWEQAAAYAGKVGKRLPTEAEWEKAARGTDGRTFPWGESHDPSFTNWDEAYPRGGSPACPRSPYGCIDMAGGAWEWTDSWYQPYPGNEMFSEEYGEKYRVIRGGASFNDVAMMRTTHRYYLPPDTTGNYHVGFRCVKDVE